MDATTALKLKQAAGAAAQAIGLALRQEYHRRDGRWWLYALGEPKRPLTDEEVAWHVARRHTPFVEGGLRPGDPRWFDEPKG